MDIKIALKKNLEELALPHAREGAMRRIIGDDYTGCVIISKVASEEECSDRSLTERQFWSMVTGFSVHFLCMLRMVDELEDFHIDKAAITDSGRLLGSILNKILEQYLEVREDIFMEQKSELKADDSVH